MIKQISKNVARTRRHVRVRKKISGTADCPRLNVYRSLSHIYAQIIDDDKGETIVSASTLDESLKGKFSGNIAGSKEVGLLVAKRALEKGVKTVVYDRGGYVYHGRVKALAEGAREGGLEF